MNKPALWMGYSLDGQDNVTIIGNITLADLPEGFHNLTVYANDIGNMSVSETIRFTISEPFPTALVLASIGTVAVVGVVLLVYFKKRKRQG